MDYLNKIYVEDIDLLLNDINLLKEGYEFNFIIDTSDIINFCFPYGVKFQKIDKIRERLLFIVEQY